jgi:XTP/dITP diphosphohydrolase
MKLYLASGNGHKAGEFQALAAASGLPVEIVSACAIGGMPEVVEDAGTFTGNALLKARALHARLPAGSWALADDSGLCVDALDGAPGVESAYYAGPGGDGAANLQKLVKTMEGIPSAQRGAHFVCVLVLIAPDGAVREFTGRVHGQLCEQPRGDTGFGYDPLFVPTGHELTFAELPATEKNRLSHRARAWAELVDRLRREAVA